MRPSAWPWRIPVKPSSSRSTAMYRLFLRLQNQVKTHPAQYSKLLTWLSDSNAGSKLRTWWSAYSRLKQTSPALWGVLTVAGLLVVLLLLVVLVWAALGAAASLPAV